MPARVDTLQFLYVPSLLCVLHRNENKARCILCQASNFSGHHRLSEYHYCRLKAMLCALVLYKSCRECNNSTPSSPLARQSLLLLGTIQMVLVHCQLNAKYLKTGDEYSQSC